MKKTGNKIVVTGGAGFIGSNVARALNESGINQIYIVDHINDDRKKNHLDNLKYEKYFEKEVFLDTLNDLNDIGIVIHLGACTDTTVYDVDYFKKNNVEYSKKLFDFCIKNNAQFIYASSAATYGDGEKGFDDSERDLKPLNPYGFSKYWFDEFVLDSAEKPPQWVGLKFFNVYGPNEDHKEKMASMIFQGYKQIIQTGKFKLFKSYKKDYPDGGQKRDFVYVKDLVDIIMFFIDNPNHSGIFNVGTGKARTFSDLAEAIFVAKDLKTNIEYIEMPEVIKDKFQYFTEANMTKLRNIGYSKSFTELEDGIRDYVQNYLTDKKV